jgi:hypothetical protein
LIEVKGTASMRVSSSGCIAWLLLLSGCVADPATTGAAAAGSTSSVAGAPAGGTSSSGAGGSVASGAGASAAGTSSSVAGAAPAGGAPASGGAPAARGGAGGGDNGDLFDPGSSVPFDPNAGGTGGAVSTGGSGGLNTDGNTVTSNIGGKASGTATFTQHGIDVDVVFSLTSCPSGVLGIHINNGDSCDNSGTEGMPWDGKRGNIGDTGSITCANNKASLMYTRKGTDPATAWTIGDHNLKTDITSYVVIVSTNADGTSAASFIGCGNFFQ